MAQPAVFAIIFMIVAGALTALQAPTNAYLANAVRSPINAALVSFLVGTVALTALAIGLGVKPDVTQVRNLPPWAWLGGLYGAVFVVAATWGVPRIGVALTITLLVAGQLLLALVLDHFGAMGAPEKPINAMRILGAVMVMGGVLLVRRF